MEAVIQVKNLSRNFGRLTVVDRLNFEVYKGEIFGFLGPNGAGKTTTVRMLTGVITPSGGTVEIENHDIIKEPLLSRAHIAVVPEQANVYLDLTVWQNVMLMGQLYGIDKFKLHREADNLLDTIGLKDRKRQKACELSKGFRQRLMLAAALVTKPDILFLDEPTSGLDVKSTRLIHQIITDLNHKGQTIFLTTHNMTEASQMCGRVAIIHKGKIAAIDNPESLRLTISSHQYVEVYFAAKPADCVDLESLPNVLGIEANELNFKLYTNTPGRVAVEVVRLADEKGLEIKHLCTCKPTLDEVFLHFTGKENREKV
ncbi:MAG: ATP-binding cassette domain-containing protein [Candidatus Omnitrophica bacterium]|nr:ATP-binding cassette domain-containing protein [Candidatus Omnitrophota bacterium]MBD3269747.1 ATP-binding cassette domain-containing protein [Candidatus Omnitrophota bacterium]